MIWWLAFEKKSFQFWWEIWIQVIVILLQLYLESVGNRLNQAGQIFFFKDCIPNYFCWLFLQPWLAIFGWWMRRLIPLLYPRTIDTQRIFFFRKSQTFGLWQTNWAENFGDICGISSQIISPRFSRLSPLSMLSIIQPLFLPKN